MKTPLYAWSGQYLGFLYRERIFDARSNYLGWVADDGRCWKSNGAFLGEVVEGKYILRRSSMATPVPRVPKTAPVKPVSPVPRTNRTGRVGRTGWVDALAPLVD